MSIANLVWFAHLVANLGCWSGWILLLHQMSIPLKGPAQSGKPRKTRLHQILPQTYLSVSQSEFLWLSQCRDEQNCLILERQSLERQSLEQQSLELHLSNSLILLLFKPHGYNSCYSRCPIWWGNPERQLEWNWPRKICLRVFRRKGIW